MELPSVVPRGFPFVPSGGFTTDDEKEKFTPRHCGSDGDVPGRDQTEPIAVVGFSLKFPQEATSSEAFWQMLMEGRSARTRIPSNRFNIDGFYHPDPQRQGSLSVKEGHFLTEDVTAFDAPFFSITPTEAASMDPQQRGLLENTYRAFENAGVSLEKAAGSRTSVHIGSFTHDWNYILTRDPLMDVKYKATGVEFSLLANRLSWFYDLVGPSISLDTACSSSLMALHLACQSLRTHESNMGVVGGANLILDPETMISMANFGMLSPDGKCYSFDQRANGYARGEGFGVVIVKRLSDALTDRDTIRAIIRATGANQDGKTAGITHPSGSAQERLIRDTYREAGLALKVTRYFEAHGTGTRTGDPIEASAIAAAFHDQRLQGDPLFIGSVKSNLGHLEGASGIAGLIKTILVLEKGLIPPNIWFDNANSRIQEEDWNIKFPVKPSPWPNSGLRRASVNSFGFGGSNEIRGLTGNHRTSEVSQGSSNACEPLTKLQLQEQTNQESLCLSQPKLFIWSGADESGLRSLASLYAKYLSWYSTVRAPEKYLENLAYTLSKRSSLRWKSCIVASSVRELHQLLEEGLSTVTRSTTSRKIGFVFTGQGAQWHAMGRELLNFPVFRDSLLDAESLLDRLGCTWRLTDEFSREQDVSNVHKPAYSQPMCTALQIALVDLLLSWGLFPARVIGHSSGEIAAAFCAGAISKTSALKIAFFRGRLAARLVEACGSRGSMMAVGLSQDNIEPYLSAHGHHEEHGATDVVVACVNSPKNITVSGREEHIDALKIILNRDGVFTRKLLHLGVAYHSKAMDEIAVEYQTLISDIRTGQPISDSLVMFSSVTGKGTSNDETRKCEYWVENMTSQVKFSEALTNLCSLSSRSVPKKLGGHKDTVIITDLLEIGPHSALRGPIREILEAHADSQSITYSSILNRNVCAATSILSALGRLHCLGYAIDTSALNGSNKGYSNLKLLSDLPEYPFNHDQCYSMESRLSKNFRTRNIPRHELLGTPASDWNPQEARWRHIIRASELPWITDHKVNGVELYPAAGFIVMAIEAIHQVAHAPHMITGYRLTDVKFTTELRSLAGSDEFETQLYLRPLESSKENSLNEFRICTLENGHWVENCRGTISAERITEDVEVDCGKEAKEERQLYSMLYETGYKKCKTTIASKQLYERLEKIGLSYGPAFQVLDDVRFDGRSATGRVKLRQWTVGVIENHYQKHIVHPTALDGLFQLAFPALIRDVERNLPTMVPDRLQNLWISSRGLSEAGSEYVQAYAAGFSEDMSADGTFMLALDAASKEPLIVARGLQTVAVGGRQLSSSSDTERCRRLCYSFTWKPDIDLLSQQELRAYCKAIENENSGFPLNERIEDLEFICFSFLSSALEELGCMDISKLKPHFQKYVAWMKYQQARYQSGELIHWRPEWEFLRQDKHYFENVMLRLKTSPEGRLYAALGTNLLAILEDRVDVLDLLFSGELAADYYEELAQRGCELLRSYLETLTHKNPSMRILEIGGGTGSTTRSILEILVPNNDNETSVPRYGSYTFTDISAGFFEKATVRFKDHVDRFTFKTLNIEKDPLQQGFLEEKYDLIIASNVLHATPKLSKTLQNVRKLLRPGGKLILFELYNERVVRAGFAFGLLPGWWLSVEENRRWGPLLPSEEWHNVLCANEFSGTDLVFRSSDDPRNQMDFHLVSTAVATPQVTPKFPKVAVIVAPTSEAHNAIADEIKSQLEILGVQECDVTNLSPTPSTPSEESFCIFLREIEENFLEQMNEKEFEGLQHLVKAGMGLIWAVPGQSSEKPQADVVVGLSRCIRSEKSDIRFITLALQDTKDVKRVAQQITKVFRNTFDTISETCESEYEERNNLLCINRVVENNILNEFIFSKTRPQKSALKKFGLKGQALKLEVGSPGLLDSMVYIEDPEVREPLAEDEVQVKVSAIGINFKDILIALGRLSEGGLGNECAGVVTRAGKEATSLRSGDRVVVTALGAYKTYVRSKALTVFKIPENMSFSEAAALPVVFCTAYQALFDVARIRAGESILIHSGAGGTGQAAVQLAKLREATIFVTVGSEEKKRLIMDLYAIPEDHIFSSRGISFTQGVKRMTNNRGVDVVLNSLAGESLEGSWKCLAPFGRFVEIGKKDILNGNKLSMYPFNENRTFSAVNLTHMLSNRPGHIQSIMEAILALANDKKICCPSPLHLYSNARLEEAFRYLQGGQNTGKTILQLNDDDLVPVVPSCRSKYSFRGDKTYLISGGLGGLGRLIARWLVQHKAENLLLLSRSGASGEEAIVFLDELRATGVNVAAPTCDISNKQSLAAVLAEYSVKMPPIKGCIQASMVLQNSLFENMSLEAFASVVRPKVHGSWNLHTMLPQDMEFCIFMSSASGISGVCGQANYAAGNTYMDALARYRVSKGLKATSLDLGVVMSSGYVAERPEVQQGLKGLGYISIQEAELLSILEYYCDPSREVLSDSRCQLITGLDTPASMRAQSLEEAYWMCKSQFKMLYQINNTSATNTSPNPESDPDLSNLLSGAGTIAESADIISSSLMSKLSKVLSMPQENIDASKPMHVFGVDSLVAVEIRNWFNKKLDANVTVFDILGNASISQLCFEAAGKS